MQDEGDGINYGLATSAACFGVGEGLTPPAPARKPALVLLVLTATREPMIPPTTRTVVAALVMEDVGTFSARMSLGDSPGARMSCMSFNGGIPPG